MRWLRPEALEALEGISPWGLLTVGVLVGTTGLPLVRKGLRGLAVGTVKGALAVSAGVQEMAQKVSQEWSELVAEVKQERESRQESWREKIRKTEIEAIKKGLDVSEKIKGTVEDIKGKVSGLVEEARKEVAGGGAAAYTEAESNYPEREKTVEGPRGNPPGREEEI